MAATIAKKDLPSPAATIKKASFLAWEFYTSVCSNPSPLPPQNTPWVPPPPNTTMINVDASFAGATTSTGLGGVVREATGCWKLGFQKKVQALDTLTAEMMAIRIGITIGIERLHGNVQIASDSKIAVEMIHDQLIHRDIYFNLVFECRELLQLHPRIYLLYQPRLTNRVADELAKKARRENLLFNFLYLFEEIPTSCVVLLHNDCS